MVSHNKSINSDCKKHVALFQTLAVYGRYLKESEINKLLSKLDGRGTDAEYDAIKKM